MRRLIGALLGVGMLAACQIALPGRDTAPAAANPITGDAVEVTSLDAPAASKPAASKPAATKPVATKPAPPDAAPAAAEPAPADLSAADPGTAEPPQAAPAPVVVKSVAQLACEKKKGVWTTAGSGSAFFCQSVTRDGGKSCRASTDCQGYCLARSLTCAPVTPMFGCQDILNEAGRMLTQCVN